MTPALRVPDQAFQCLCLSRQVPISFRSRGDCRTRSHRQYNHHPLRRYRRTRDRRNFCLKIRLSTHSAPSTGAYHAIGAPSAQLASYLRIEEWELKAGRLRLRTPQEGDRRGCLLSTPQKTKFSPVFPVVGQLLQRHARHLTSNGHSGGRSTARCGSRSGSWRPWGVGPKVGGRPADTERASC